MPVFRFPDSNQSSFASRSETSESARILDCAASWNGQATKYDRCDHHEPITRRFEPVSRQGSNECKATIGKLRVRVAVLAVETPPRFPEAVRMLDDPGPQRDHANEQVHAHVG